MPPESASFMSSIPSWLLPVLPWFLLILGGSFLYKSFLAIFWGRTRYWHGFLPISLVSPLFIHMPSTERSPIKTTHQWWVHIVLGPLFLFLGLGCLAAGADLLGWEGTKSVNKILVLGQDHIVDKDGHSRPVQPPIVFDRDRGYSFPMFQRLRTHFTKTLSEPVMKGGYNEQPAQQEPAKPETETQAK